MQLFNGFQQLLQIEQSLLWIAREWDWKETQKQYSLKFNQSGWGLQYSYEEDDEEPIWISSWSGSVLLSIIILFYLLFCPIHIWELKTNV